MKIIGITSTTILSFLLAIAPSYAQQERENEKQDHPAKEQSKQEKAKPAQHAQQESKPAQQQHAEQQQEQNKESRQPAQQQQRQDQNKQEQQAQQRGNQRAERTPEQKHVQQAAWQEHRSQHWDSDHRNWQQRGGYNGYRIPDDRFRGYFGQEHDFRIYGLPFLVVGGYPRFQYEGYWFSMVDPWPEYWGNDWYDNDDVYVVYMDNGYYLYNRRYPNVGMAISISM
jgi:flagellar motor protein MotB